MSVKFSMVLPILRRIIAVITVDLGRLLMRMVQM